MGRENKYVEEVGSMNMFFQDRRGGNYAAVGGSILPGITRDSIIQLCKDMGVPVTERKLSMEGEFMRRRRTLGWRKRSGQVRQQLSSPVGSLIWEEKGDYCQRRRHGRADTEAVRYADGNSVWPYRRSSWMGT